jgi:predicted cobalt transporter CbtA
MRALLIRGMVSGLAAALLTTVFAAVFGEPGIEGGITFEEQAAAGGTAEVEAVSRGVQATVGLAAALLIYGVAIGGLFALGYAVVNGRIGRLSARATAGLLALGGFLVIVVVPFLKYPPNPPGATDADTISQRTELYLVMVLISVVIAVAAIAAARWISPRMGAWNGGTVAGGAYLVVIGLTMYAMPAVDKTPAGFPAAVLYDFRLASIGTQAVLWATLGLVFGALVERNSSGERGRARSTARPGGQ